MKFSKHYLIILTILLPLRGEVGYPQHAQKVTVLWVDPLLNVQDIYTESGIISILTKAKQAGIGAIALGIKCNTGEVIYESNLAPPLLGWEDYHVPVGFDPVRIFLEEGRRRQLQIYAVFPVFSEGHMVERQGPIYKDRQNWQSKVYVIEDEKATLEPITQWASGTTAFANPLRSDVQEYEIAVLKEFLERYSVDGLILDKAQFSGIEADFSDYTKGLFQSFLGSANAIQWWPEDVYELQFVDAEWQVIPGQYFSKWIEFRAESIRRFVKRLVEQINSVDPTLPLGQFVGAWYPTYYEYGLNWASESNLIEEDWATQEYYKTATAELFNYLIVGCYFPRISIEEAEDVGAEWWMSVEGSSLISMEVVNDACPVYGSILVGLYKNDSESFKAALQTAITQTNGLYLYDFSYIERYEYWDEIADALSVAPRKGLTPDF